MQAARGTKKEEVLSRRKIGKCLNNIGWDVVRRACDTDGEETNLRMDANTKLLSTTVFGPGAHNTDAIQAWIKVYFSITQRSPEKRLLFLSHFSVEKPSRSAASCFWCGEERVTHCC